jgi:hypothetical protein
MKLNVLAIALAATALGSLGATAQVVIEERRDPAVVIERDKPDTSVTVEQRGLFGDKKVIKRETTGAGDCESKTVHKEDLLGSKTVTKTKCD